MHGGNLLFKVLCVMATLDFIASDDAITNGSMNFPKNFMWAVGSSAFQIEGAFGDRGPSVWDTFSSQENAIIDGSNASVACNSYEFYEKDIGALKFLNVSHYRMSISWSRILPDGTGKVNPAGVAYYKSVLSALKASNIEPLVTLYHWDLPQALEDQGGWLNRDSIDWFQEYARVCFSEFGSYVKMWITIHDPFTVSLLGYGTGVLAPGKEGPGTLAYQAGHNLLLAHAKVYYTYKKEFKRQQKGKIGIVNSADWYEPESERLSDIEASDRANHFRLGWFSEPIFGKSGDYPSVMKRRVERNSKRQGLEESRLPRFTNQEKRQLKRSADFFGLNFNTVKMVKARARVNLSSVHWETDRAVHGDDNEWPRFTTLNASPTGLRGTLKWIKEHYNNPEVIVFESGFGDSGELSDNGRIGYLREHIKSVLRAIQHDDVNVTGYVARGLTDAFEWIWGYSTKFGLFHIDFNTSELERMPKESAFYYSQVIRYNGFGKEPMSENGAMHFVTSSSLIVIALILLKTRLNLM